MKRKIKMNTYAVVDAAIGQAIRRGIARYYKYREESRIKDEVSMMQEIREAIMLELSDVIEW